MPAAADVGQLPPQRKDDEDDDHDDHDRTYTDVHS
jgi:hypothetical protein